MTLHIKNWHQFQHFKDRRPPWVKLYRDLLDDIEWHDLDPKAAKALVMLWLIASETDGALPDLKKLAFRLRLSESVTSDLLSKLSHWLEQDDDSAISDGYQSDAPETETEKRRKETEQKARDFEIFWDIYPKKDGKKDAESAWLKVAVPVDTIVAAVKAKAATEDWLKAKGQFVPLAATYLRGRRWEDAGTTVPAPKHTDTAEDTRRMLDQQRQGTTGMPAEVRQFAKQITGRRVA